MGRRKLALRQRRSWAHPWDPMEGWCGRFSVGKRDELFVPDWFWLWGSVKVPMGGRQPAALGMHCRAEHRCRGQSSGLVNN